MKLEFQWGISPTNQFMFTFLCHPWCRDLSVVKNQQHQRKVRREKLPEQRRLQVKKTYTWIFNLKLITVFPLSNFFTSISKQGLRKYKPYSGRIISWHNNIFSYWEFTRKCAAARREGKGTVNLSSKLKWFPSFSLELSHLDSQPGTPVSVESANSEASKLRLKIKVGS